MFCPQCGAQLPDGSKFCAKCGAQLGSAPTQTAAAPQVPQTPPDFGNGTPVVPGRSKPKTGLIVAGVAAIVVVALAIWGIVSCVGGGSKGSAQGVADGVTASFNTMIDGDFSADSITKCFDGIIDLMPPEAVENALTAQGMTRQDLSESLSTMFGSVEDYTQLVSLIDMKFTASVGAPLDADELADVTAGLNAAGMNVNVTEGNHIAYSMDMSAFGQSDTQTTDESGMYAININGSWYLWGRGGLGL